MLLIFHRTCFTLSWSSRYYSHSNANGRFLYSNAFASQLGGNLFCRGLALDFSCHNHADVEYLNNNTIQHIRSFQNSSRPPSDFARKSTWWCNPWTLRRTYQGLLQAKWLLFQNRSISLLYLGCKYMYLYCFLKNLIQVNYFSTLSTWSSNRIIHTTQRSWSWA